MAPVSGAGTGTGMEQGAEANEIAGTGVETCGRTQDGNGDGREWTETRPVAEMGTGTRIGSGRVEER